MNRLSLPSQTNKTILRAASEGEAKSRRRTQGSVTLIPRAFTSEGFVFRQLVRKGMWAIYEQRRGVDVVSYEVVKLRRESAREIYPRNRFGLTERNKAFETFRRLSR